MCFPPRVEVADVDFQVVTANGPHLIANDILFSNSVIGLVAFWGYFGMSHVLGVSWSCSLYQSLLPCFLFVSCLCVCLFLSLPLVVAMLHYVVVCPLKCVVPASASNAVKELMVPADQVEAAKAEAETLPNLDITKVCILSCFKVELQIAGSWLGGIFHC